MLSNIYTWFGIELSIGGSGAKGHIQAGSVERIKQNGFYADIICDVNAVPVTWHCIVQHHGCTDVLFWSQEDSREHAVQAADGALQDLKEGGEDSTILTASIAEKKFMTLHATTQRLRSRR
jgi:hypothetical protein